MSWGHQKNRSKSWSSFATHIPDETCAEYQQQRLHHRVGSKSGPVSNCFFIERQQQTTSHSQKLSSSFQVLEDTEQGGDAASIWQIHLPSMILGNIACTYFSSKPWSLLSLLFHCCNLDKAYLDRAIAGQVGITWTPWHCCRVVPVFINLWPDKARTDVLSTFNAWRRVKEGDCSNQSCKSGRVGAYVCQNISGLHTTCL